MRNKIVLSIVIVNYNTQPFLEECLDSLKTYPFKGGSSETIVVDNNSKKFNHQRIRKKYPHIKIIRNIRNLGYAAANNIGIKYSTGTYVLLLNPDTVVQNKTLDSIYNFMEKNKQAQIATCYVELTNGRIDDACHRGFPTPWNAFCHFSGLSTLFPKSIFLNGYHLGYEDINKIHEIDSCCGAFMFIRRKIGDAVGWLDEDYFWYGEDLDFCYRIKQIKGRIYFLPFVKVIHHKGVSSGIKKHSKKISTANQQTKLLATKARFDVMKIFYRKHYKSKYPWILTTIVLAAVVFAQYFHTQKIFGEDNLN